MSIRSQINKLQYYTQITETAFLPHDKLKSMKIDNVKK